MGDHNDGFVEFVVQPVEQGQHVVGRLSVQVPGGLVGHDDRRVGDDGPGDGHPLLLAAGKLGGPVIGPFGQVDRRQGGRGMRLRSVISLSKKRRWPMLFLEKRTI